MGSKKCCEIAQKDLKNVYYSTFNTGLFSILLWFFVMQFYEIFITHQGVQGGGAGGALSPIFWGFI